MGPKDDPSPFFSLRTLRRPPSSPSQSQLRTRVSGYPTSIRTRLIPRDDLGEARASIQKLAEKRQSSLSISAEPLAGPPDKDSRYARDAMERGDHAVYDKDYGSQKARRGKEEMEHRSNAWEDLTTSSTITNQDMERARTHLHPSSPRSSGEALITTDDSKESFSSDPEIRRISSMQSIRSGVSNTSSIENPETLAKVEDAIKLHILPELNALKNKRNGQQSPTSLGFDSISQVSLREDHHPSLNILQSLDNEHQVSPENLYDEPNALKTVDNNVPEENESSELNKDQVPKVAQQTPVAVKPISPGLTADEAIANIEQSLSEEDFTRFRSVYQKIISINNRSSVLLDNSRLAIGPTKSAASKEIEQEQIHGDGGSNVLQRNDHETKHELASQLISTGTRREQPYLDGSPKVIQRSGSEITPVDLANQKSKTETITKLSDLSEFSLKPPPLGDKYGWTYGHHVLQPLDPDPLIVCNPLGHGSLGTVEEVRCRDTQLPTFVRKRVQLPVRQRRIILKIIEEEARNLKSLVHFHIVETIGSYEDLRQNNRHFYCLLMSPVGDNDLKTFLEIAGDEVLLQKRWKDWIQTWFVCLTTALKYMHERGIRHQDIKPSNIIHREGRILFTDFSSSTRFEVGHTTSTENPSRSSPMYAAPEVADRFSETGLLKKHGCGSDIFALGCVFSDMLSVLERSSVPALHDFLLRNGSKSGYVTAPAIGLVLYSQRLDLIHEWFRDSTFFKMCISPMLAMDRLMRPSAAKVLDKIVSTHPHFISCTCNKEVQLTNAEHLGHRAWEQFKESEKLFMSSGPGVTFKPYLDDWRKDIPVVKL